LDNEKAVKLEYCKQSKTCGSADFNLTRTHEFTLAFVGDSVLDFSNTLPFRCFRFTHTLEPEKKIILTFYIPL